MKKGIILLFFCCSFNWFSFNVLTAKWFKKELAKDLRAVLINQGIDLEESAEDLIFEYKIYKKLIQDSLLDELIKNAGLEPNEENRMIFFSALSKDIQNHVKKSFSNFTENKNQPKNRNQNIAQDYHNRSNFNGMDPSFYYQAEMTRNLYSMLPFMNSKSDESKGIKKRHLVLGGVLIYFITKFGILGTGIRIAHRCMEANKGVKNIVSKASDMWNAMIHGSVVEMSREEFNNFKVKIKRHNESLQRERERRNKRIQERQNLDEENDTSEEFGEEDIPEDIPLPVDNHNFFTYNEVVDNMDIKGDFRWLFNRIGNLLSKPKTNTTNETNESD